jgi:hypothetical protein
MHGSDFPGSEIVCVELGNLFSRIAFPAQPVCHSRANRLDTLMSTEELLNLFRFTYVSPASKTPYGFTVGLPQSIFQRVAKPVTGIAILERLSDSEKKQLQERLSINVSVDAFVVDAFAPLRDTLVGLESFNGDDGKRFWIYPKKILDF